MPTIRPYINENLIIKIKLAYPKETALLDIGETVEFAIKKALCCKDREDAEKVFPKVNNSSIGEK